MQGKSNDWFLYVKQDWTELKYSNFISICRGGVCQSSGTHNTTFYQEKFADREKRDLLDPCENEENGYTWSVMQGNHEVQNKLLNNLYFILVGLWFP